MFRTVDPVASTTLQSYEHRQLLHRARRYIYIKGAVNTVIALLFLLTFPPELRPGMVAIVLVDALCLIPYWFLVQRYPTSATCLSLCITSLAISAGDWVGGYQTGASGILYALLILGGHLILIKPFSTYLVSGLVIAIYLGTIVLEVKGVIPITFPFTLSNLSRVVSLNVITMFGLTILTGVVTRLYRELLHRNKELFALNAVSAAASQSLNVDEVLQLALDKVMEVMDLEGGGLYLLEASTGEMVLKAHRTLAVERLSMDAVVSSMEGRIGGFTDSPLGTGQVLVIDDPSQHPKVSEIVGDINGNRPLAMVLLKAEDRMLGVMNLLGRVGCSFTSRDVELLKTLGAQIGLAVENARIYEEERKRVIQLELIGRITQRIASILDLDELLHQVAHLIGDAFGYYHTGIHLVEVGSDELVLKAGAGPFIETLVNRLRFKIGQEGITGWVAQSGEPLLVNDVSREPRYYPTEESKDTRSELTVPIKLKGEIIGVLDVQSVELDAFDEGDVSILQTLADQLAIAIANAHLYEQATVFAAKQEDLIQERTEELIRKAKDISFLYQASVDLSSGMEKDEVLNILARQALLTMDAVDCTIYELQDDTLIAVARHRNPALARKDPESGRHYLLADYPAVREAIEKVQPLRMRVDDPLADKAERVELQRLGYTALLQVHIVSRDQVLGVVEVLDNKLEREFGEEDAALLQTIANQASMAIEKAHFFQQLREERNHLELLYEVSRKLSASLDLEQTLHDVFQVSVAATGASRGSVLIFDDEGRASYRILRQDLSPAMADDVIDRVLRKGLAGWVLERKQPTIVFDASRDERWLPFPDDPEPVGSAMAIPFIERDRVQGVLTLVHPQPSHFDQTHLELLSSIAHQVAVVIERARLYEETRRRAQEVAQQKEQTDAIVQSMADGLIVTDLENRLVLTNPAAEELLKLRLEDAIGQEIGVNIRDDRLRQIVRDTLDKQQAGYEVDIELTDPYDEAQKIIRAHTAVVNDPSGQPMGIVTTLRDVTHEREVQRLKDELISTVSHELRTPMTSVLGFSELLLTRQLSEKQRKLYIQTIHKEAERLSALINDFLDIQRMEQGQQEYHFEEVDLSEMAREMVATYSGQSEAHTLTLDLPSELPLVQADPDRLKQVLGNLLSNAIKFSPAGGMVTVSAQVWGDTIRVAVSDEGIGVPTDDLLRIFEKFFKVDRSDRRAIPGTGLGLAICKEIVEAHEGCIWAESPSTSLRTGQEEKGTTVIFSLPIRISKRILVIDDEKDIRDMFQRLLSESYEVVTAVNGQEGLSLMEEELPDLVILDIAMPVMDGYQFLERVKGDQRTKDIPVIAISGVDTDINRLQELETDEFMSKPFSGTVLLGTMQRLLKRS